MKSKETKFHALSVEYLVLITFELKNEMTPQTYILAAS
jgi:hypothetical protein